MAYKKKKTPGRKEGVKNLIKTETGVINQFGVEITYEEKKALEYAVNTANRKRREMLKQEAALPHKLYGVLTGNTNRELQLMGRESDFILAQKSKSVQRFKTRKEFDNYMKNLERVNKRDYVTERVRLYKRNHMAAIKNVLGPEGAGIAMKIRMMKPEEYMKMVQQEDEALEIQFLYGVDQKERKINVLRAALGMKPLEDPLDDEME